MKWSNKPGHPLGGYVVRQYENSTEQRFIGVAGISYTMENSTTLSFEYMYNGAGYNDTEAGNYYYLRNNAADNFNNPALRSVAGSILGVSLDPGSILLRQHYLFAQYVFNKMGSDLGYTLRWTTSLDDWSDMITAIVEYAYNDNLQLFTTANYYGGNENTEFTSMAARKHNDRFRIYVLSHRRACKSEQLAEFSV